MQTPEKSRMVHIVCFAAYGESPSASSYCGTPIEVVETLGLTFLRFTELERETIQSYCWSIQCGCVAQNCHSSSLVSRRFKTVFNYLVFQFLPLVYNLVSRLVDKISSKVQISRRRIFATNRTLSLHSWLASSQISSF